PPPARRLACGLEENAESRRCCSPPRNRNRVRWLVRGSPGGVSVFFPTYFQSPYPSGVHPCLPRRSFVEVVCMPPTRWSSAASSCPRHCHGTAGIFLARRFSTFL